MSAELGRKRVSQTDPLQQAPQGRALCGLEAAATLFTVRPCRLSVTAVRRGEVRCDLRQSELAVRKEAGELRWQRLSCSSGTRCRGTLPRRGDVVEVLLSNYSQLQGT